MNFTNEEKKAIEDFLNGNDTDDYQTYQEFLNKFEIDANKMGDFLKAMGQSATRPPVFLNNPDWKVNNFAVNFDNGYAVSLVFDDVGRRITGQDLVEVQVSLHGNVVEEYPMLNPMQYADLLHKVRSYPKKKEEQKNDPFAELLANMAIMEALLSAIKNK